MCPKKKFMQEWVQNSKLVFIHPKLLSSTRLRRSLLAGPEESVACDVLLCSAYRLLNIHAVKNMFSTSLVYIWCR